MNLDDITTKCYILALVIRDDGERLLLGDGYFEFKDALQHFQPNTYVNDVVELQGTDGQLLAGQVRRTATQSFDGYIGDAITSKQMIEQKRKDFIMFFRKKHFYKVVYIFPDGTAIQRKRGYIVDAPSVPEIWQKFPEYHIGLNFEDPNYYEYAENNLGDEIFAHIVSLYMTLNIGAGLVWDEDGAVSDTWGYIWDGVQVGPQIPPEYTRVEYIYATNSNTYITTNLTPSISSILEARVYSVNQSEQFVVSTATYRIAKFTANRKVGATVGSTNYTSTQDGSVPVTVKIDHGKVYIDNALIGDGSGASLGALAPLEINRGKYGTSYYYGYGRLYYVRISVDGVNDDFIGYPVRDQDNTYGLFNTVDQTFYPSQGTNKFRGGPDSPDIPVPISGPTIVTVDGVDSALPTWQVDGPATNPTITNLTTGKSMTWVGTVPAYQKLVVDMAEMTATLEGANVFEYLSGEWIELVAGNNTISYSATGTVDPSKLSWNGVEG